MYNFVNLIEALYPISDYYFWRELKRAISDK